MCILFVYVNPSPQSGEYKFILASNRDEIFKRPAKPLHQWEDHQGVYGGTDMQPGKEGGTWLAMNKKGRVGVLLNIGQGKDLNHVDASSARGFYATEWVIQPSHDMNSLFETVKNKHGNQPALFRLVTFDVNKDPQMGTLTKLQENDQFKVEHHPPGFHGLGNNADGVTWKKVVEGKAHFQSIVETLGKIGDEQNLIDQLLEMLSSKMKHFPDSGLSQQMEGRPEKVIECLSSIYVEIPKVYGTRTQSVILVDADNKATFFERTMDGIPGETTVEWIENCQRFPLED